MTNVLEVQRSGKFSWSSGYLTILKLAFSLGSKEFFVLHLFLSAPRRSAVKLTGLVQKILLCLLIKQYTIVFCHKQHSSRY